MTDSGREELLELPPGPGAEPGLRIGGQVGRVDRLAVGRAVKLPASQQHRGSQLLIGVAEPLGVAVHAAVNRSGEIPAVGGGGPASRHDHPRVAPGVHAGRERQGQGSGQGQARTRDAVRPGSHQGIVRPQEADQGRHVGIGEPGEARHGGGVPPVPVEAIAQQSRQRAVAPVADAGLPIGGEVGGPDLSHERGRAHHAPAAGRNHDGRGGARRSMIGTRRRRDLPAVTGQAVGAKQAPAPRYLAGVRGAADGRRRYVMD